GRVSPPPGRKRHRLVTVPGLRRDVHGALPQHHARGQRYAVAVGDRRQRGAVPAAAADPDPEATGRDLRAADRHPPERLLRWRKEIAAWKHIDRCWPGERGAFSWRYSAVCSGPARAPS